LQDALLSATPVLRSCHRALLHAAAASSTIKRPPEYHLPGGPFFLFKKEIL
jgi:hypothetical protein